MLTWILNLNCLKDRKSIVGFDIVHQNKYFTSFLVGENHGPGERGLRHWVRRTNLVDSRTSVTDVKFAPKHLGLVLATCSADGIIRIYEAP